MPFYYKIKISLYILIYFNIGVLNVQRCKTSVFVLEKTAGLVWYAGSSAVYWYYSDEHKTNVPNRLTFNDKDMLVVEFNKLKNEMECLKKELHEYEKNSSCDE